MAFKLSLGLQRATSALGVSKMASNGYLSSQGQFRFKSDAVSEAHSLEEGSYLWKVDDVQKTFVYAHRANTRFPSPWFTLNSKRPLTPEIVYKAMLHLHKKCPVFQLTVKERDGELWWYKRDDLAMDFKVVEKGGDKFEVIDNFLNEGFDDENGPSWKVRFMDAKESDPYPMPELKKEFPYQYYLVTCAHHAIADGYTTTILAQANIDMINAVIEGEDIDDSVPIGEFVSNEECEAAELMFRVKLLKDPARFEEVKAEVIRADKPPLLLRIFPRPQVDQVTTKHKSIHVPKDVLARFAEQCKKNGVTIGTGFQTATNTALIELAQEAGDTADSYDISVNMATDLRRYMKKRKYPIMGLHVRTTTSMVTIGKNIREEFWDNCRNVQKINSELLTSGAVVEQNIVRQLVNPSLPPEEYYKTFPEVIRDYGYSNLGNFDRVVPGLGKHVQLTGLDPYSSIHQFIYPFLAQMLTFRGNLVYAISYATDWLTDESASLIASKFTSVITRHSSG